MSSDILKNAPDTSKILANKPKPSGLIKSILIPSQQPIPGGPEDFLKETAK
jgi:hypothetical protein